MKLSERQREVLEDVQSAGFDEGEWFRPMDIGGRNGSDHSAILSALVSKGLLESRQRMHGSRGSKVYRLSISTSPST